MKPIFWFFLFLGSLTLSSCDIDPPPPSPSQEVLQQQQRRIVELESQLDGVRDTSDRWKLLCAAAGVGALVLLIFGTALGAKTRHDAYASS
jgi:hypothetical protein